MSPTVNDLDEVYDQFKTLFPEIEDDSERGRTIRSRLNEAMAKLALTRYGQENGAKYPEAYPE